MQVKHFQGLKMSMGQVEGQICQVAPRLQVEKTFQGFDVMSSMIQRHFDWSEVHNSRFSPLKNSTQE